MSEVKVNKISPRTNCGTVTVGDSGDSVSVTAGVSVTVNGDLKSNALKATDGGVIINQCGTTITLGASGDTIALASGASQTGFGSAGQLVDWQTAIQTSTPFTAVSGKGYFINTTSGAITMNLPSSPSVGDIVAIKDYASKFSTNNLTIGRGGSNMNGNAADSVRNTNNESLTLLYADATQGWLSIEEGTGYVGESFMTATGGTVSTSGNDKIHIFTGPGTFRVCSVAACAANNQVSYMVVGGGGAGSGTTAGGGGGGAGGFREDKSPVTPYTASPLEGAGTITVTATNYPITIGAGASGGVNPGNSGSSTIFSTITSAGGGGGGGLKIAGTAGASGGGGGGRCGAAGGGGNTPPVSPAQGSAGGSAKPQSSPASDAGGGGGGATAVGANGQNDPNPAGNGGAGATTQITASPVVYAGGGGGAREGSGNGGTGGPGGGGAGSPPTPVSGDAGTVNSGGGGGAGNVGGAGGSGIVIIRYKYQ